MVFIENFKKIDRIRREWNGLKLTESPDYASLHPGYDYDDIPMQQRQERLTITASSLVYS